MIGCALSADGHLALTASRDGTLRLWNTRGQLLRVLKGHQGTIHGCALNSDGCFALSVDDQTLRLWDTTSGQEIARWTHDISLWCCALSANGRLVMVSDILGGVHFLNLVGVDRAEDVSTAELPVSWLAEKPSRKPNLLQWLFGRHKRLNASEKPEKIEG